MAETCLIFRPTFALILKTSIFGLIVQYSSQGYICFYERHSLCIILNHISHCSHNARLYRRFRLVFNQLVLRQTLRQEIFVFILPGQEPDQGPLS